MCIRDRPSTAAIAIPNESYLSDDAVIAKASAAQNGEKFKRLWNGDITGYKLSLIHILNQVPICFERTNSAKTIPSSLHQLHVQILGLHYSCLVYTAGIQRRVHMLAHLEQMAL